MVEVGSSFSKYVSTEKVANTAGIDQGCPGNTCDTYGHIFQRRNSLLSGQMFFDGLKALLLSLLAIGGPYRLSTMIVYSGTSRSWR